MVEGILTEFEQFNAVSFPYACDLCNTDIEVEVREFSPSSNMVAIIITRWTNLGQGLTQEDRLWKAHLRTSGQRMENHARLSDRPSHALKNGGQPRLKHDKIIQFHRTIYENKTELSYKDLRLINLSYLRDDDYKYAMEEGAKNSWTIPFKESEDPLSNLWKAYCRHRSFGSTWRTPKETVIEEEILPKWHIDTSQGREKLFDIVFMPIKRGVCGRLACGSQPDSSQMTDKPPAYCEQPPVPVPYGRNIGYL
ncbi:hypothetical protein PENSTE_c003G00012 [Penicillium steckii]|uniref:Uncharacterized protein n=1 Tax=Penicillium steckii TaxID=303698 RepID=A0A1V6TQF4_9EURO|nr:hypothetical protein PENSTE_c003G00012 [Penicillium steckii]